MHGVWPITLMPGGPLRKLGSRSQSSIPGSASAEINIIRRVSGQELSNPASAREGTPACNL